MSRPAKTVIGKKGEEIAAKFLTDQGYRIIKRNYYTRYGELDIICLHQKTLVFVEVRTKTNTNFGLPEESITPGKIKHLRKAALMYLGNCPVYYEEIRFDVIAILISGDNTSINHIPYAF
jgi:putative endonuclease